MPAPHPAELQVAYYRGFGFPRPLSTAVFRDLSSILCLCMCVLYVCGGFGGLLHGTIEGGMAAFHPRNPKQRFPLKHCQGTGQGHTCCLAPNIRLASTFTAAPKLPGFKPQYTEQQQHRVVCQNLANGCHFFDTIVIYLERSSVHSSPVHEDLSPRPTFRAGTGF